MANTLTQIYLHLIFAVKNRTSLIPTLAESRLHAYLGGVLKQHNHIPLAIGGTADHVHILVRYNVNQSVPDLVRDLKSSSSKFMSQHRVTPFKFEWQNGYAAFSYSQSQVEQVRRYVENQHVHHNGLSLRDEVKSILDKFGVEYDERYIICEPS